MALHLRTSARTATAQGIITDAGSSAKLKFYNGTRPSALSAVSGGNTLLATVTFGATIGTASSGAIDWDEAGASQTSSSHVTGTPTFVDLTTSGDVLVARLDLGSGAWTFTGSITNGQNISLTSLVWTMPHAA